MVDGHMLELDKPARTTGTLAAETASRVSGKVDAELPAVGKRPSNALLKLHPGQFAMQLFYDEAMQSASDFTLTVDGSKILHLTTQNTAVVRLDYLNQIVNGEFADPKHVPWRYPLPSGGYKVAGTNFSADTTLEGAGTAHVFLKETQRSANLEYTGTGEAEHVFPVEPNGKVCISGYFGTHRCSARLLLEFRGAANRTIEQQEAAIDQNVPGGRLIEGYQHVSLIAVAPAGASGVTVRLGAELVPSATDGFLFFTRLWFGRIAGSEVPPWSPSLVDVVGLDKAGGLRGQICLSIPLPADCLDGTPHTIRVVSRSSGLDVEGSPVEVLRHLDVTGEIVGIAGASVQAQLLVDSRQGLQPLVELLVDQEAAGVANAEGQGRRRSVALPIPSQFCDGRPHVFTIRLRHTGQVLAHMPALSPTSLTPFETLQTYAGLPIDASLSPAARTRYRALLDNLGAKRAAIDLKWLHDRLLRGPVKESQYEKLTFDTPANPVVSIVVPVKDHFDMTYFCLCALLFSYNEASFEVIVVDDGSSDETAEIEQIVEGVKVVRHATAAGFVRACNDGAQAASGQYVVFLNNDTEVTSRWLDEMLYVFDRFAGVGLVGSKLLYPDGSQQEAGGIVWENGNPWNYGRKANPAAPQYSYTRQVDYLSGAAIMVPRQVWQEVGGFSEEFAPAYFEDTDLAFKIRDRGLKTVFAPLSVVYHYEGISSGTNVNSGAKRFQEVNRPKFKRKWSTAYRANGPEGVDVDMAKDRGVRLRALLMDFEIPRPDFDAGSYAAIQEIRALQALGFKVTFVPTNFAYLGRQTERLQRMGVEALYAPFASSIESLLASRGSEFDLIYVTRYQVARQVADSIRRHAPKAKFLINLADLHFLRELRASLARGDQSALGEALRTRDAELAVLRLADLALSYSPVEQAVILSHNLDTPKVALLPWIAESRPSAVPFAERRGISFLGGFRHAPNSEAVEFFIERVMPKLALELPDVTFEIYGSAISEEKKKKWTRGDVVVKGQIAELDTLFDRTRVFVAPLVSGGGVKGKVFDCLSYGVPSVISPVAAEGIGLRDGLETMIASTPDEWTAKVKLLYTDEEAWGKVSAAARHFVDARHSFEQGVELMRRALEEVGLYCSPDDRYLVANTSRP